MATLDEYSATPRQYFSLEKDDYVTQVIPSGSSPTGWTNLRGQPVDVKGGTIDGMPAEQVGRMEVGPATSQVGIPKSANQGSSISDDTGFTPKMTVAPNTASSSTTTAPKTPQLTSSNAKITNLDWLNAGSGPTVPVSIGGKNYIYFPESYYAEGLTVGRGAIDPFSGNVSSGNYLYSPAFLQEGIEKKFIPVTLGQDVADELKKLQSDVFYGEDPDKKIQNYLNSVGPNIDKLKNFDKGYLIPAEDFQSATKNASTPDAYTGGQLQPFVQMDLSSLKEPPTGLMLRNGQKSYASASGLSYTDPSGQFWNYNPPSGGGGLLDDLGLGGITDVIQDLGPIGQIGMAIATGGLSLPEQLAAMTAYNAAGGASFEDALKNAAVSTALSQGIQSLAGGPNLGSTNPADYAGLQSGLGGGEFSESLGAGADDIMTSIGGAGQMGGVPTGGIGDLVTSTTLPKTDYSLSSGKEGLGLKASAPTTTVPDFSEFSEVGGVDYGIYEPGSGGGLGLKPGVAGNLASMGGGQGLTAPAFGQPGSIVSEGGINTGLLTASGLGGTLGKELAAINTGVPTTDTGIAGLTAADDVAAQQATANAIVPPDAGAGVADLAGTTAGAGMAGAAGAAGAGIGLADALKYAGLAGLASTLLGGGQTAGGGGGGVDQTPVGAGLSPDYKPYRYQPYAAGGITALAGGGYNLGGYSDGGRLLRGPGDGVSDDIPASIGGKQPARLADGEFVIPARIVSEIGNGSTDAGARKLYEMMDRVQSARRKTMGKKQFAKDTKADKYFPA